MTLLLCLSTLSSFGQTREKQNALVEKVLNNMVNGSTMSVGSFISPAYLKAHNVSAGSYQINTYSPVGFSVDENKGNGVVEARIWGSSRGWVHRLTFIVTYEDGSYYFMPGREPSTYMYIDPWFKVETNVVEVAERKTEIEKNDQTELVDKICYAMVYEQSSFDSDMRLYIAPSYYKKFSIDPFVFLVNRYSPVGYSIESVDNRGIVKAKIWGENGSWVHELTFKVVEENGLLYVMPGKHHPETEYVDPWFSARTSITE